MTCSSQGLGPQCMPRLTVCALPAPAVLPCSYAREHEPCIIFMDEIDAIGGKRFSEGTSADREVGWGWRQGLAGAAGCGLAAICPSWLHGCISAVAWGPVRLLLLRLRICGSVIRAILNIYSLNHYNLD